MGIDVFMSATPAPTDQHGRVSYPLRRPERSIMHRRVDGLSDRIVMACADTIGVDPDELDPASWVRSFLHDAVDAVLVEAPPWCAILQVARPWIVTGGTSCGDMPPAYEHVEAARRKWDHRGPIRSEQRMPDVYVGSLRASRSVVSYGGTPRCAASRCPLVASAASAHNGCH